MLLLDCHYIEFEVMNPMFFCLLHSKKLNKVCDKWLPSCTGYFSLYLYSYSESGTETLL